MAGSDDIFYDYQLMNDTFTATGGKSADMLITGRFDPKPFEMTDTKGRTFTFLDLYVLQTGDKFYAYLLPLDFIQGRKDGEPLFFDVDASVVPFTMRAVKDEKKAEEIRKKVSDAWEHQNYKKNNFGKWLRDIKNGETLRLMVKPNVSVGFERLSVMERDGELYVVIKPVDHLELFEKDAVIVYKCNYKVSPAEFVMPEESVCEDILAEYYSTRKNERRPDRPRAGEKIVYDDFFEKTSFVPADERNIYEILLVRNEKDLGKPYTLKDGRGREISFKTEAVYSHDLRLYAVLNPVTEIMGCDADTELLYLVDDEVTPPVLRVVTDDALYARILDDIYDMFGEDEEIKLMYPRAWMILKFNLDALLVFCKGRDGAYCRFTPVYVDTEPTDKMYAVLRALLSSAGFEKDVEYVFGMEKRSETDYGDPEPVTDAGIIANVMRKRRWKAGGKSAPSAAGEGSGLVFMCRKCHAKYRGNVCPTCGTPRENADSATFPACTFLDIYSESYCRGYVAWELERFKYKTADEYTRCRDGADAACVLDFVLTKGGYAVTGIGGCKAENIEIPTEYNGLPVVGIEKGAFSKSRVVRVRVPGSVKYVGASAFEGCPELRLVRFDSFVPEIEERTYADCPKFRGMDINEGTVAIGAGAFSGCPSIDEVQIPKSLTAVGRDAFDGCTSLRLVYYEGCEKEWEKVKTEEKGNGPFLRSDVIFYSREKPAKPGRFWHYMDGRYSSRIRWKAYRDPVTDYSLYPSNEYLPTYGLKYRESEGGYVVVGRGRCEEKNIVIPPTYKGKKVLGVEDGAFLGDDVIRNLVVSKGVVEIGDGAFQDCDNLKGAVILGGPHTIEARTFSGCRELSYLVLPEDLSNIEKHAFDDCDMLTIFFKGDKKRWEGVKISKQNEDWLFTSDYVSFYSEGRPTPVKGHWHYSEKFKPTKWTGAQKAPNAACGPRDGGAIKFPFDPAVCLPREEVLVGSAEDCDLPHGLEYQRFGKCCAVTGPGHCTDIKSDLVIPSMYNGLLVAAIGPGVFRGCKEIHSLTVPEGVKRIDSEAFRDCANLTKLDIPDGLEKIGDFAFSSCGMEEVVMPNDMWYHLGKSAFENCKRLRSVFFGERMFDIPACAFRGCTALEYIVFPHYFSNVGPCAFESCTSLRSVFYLSTEKEWKSKNKYSRLDKNGNECLEAATVYFYSEDRPVKSGNFWHYDDEDTPAIWDV